MQRGRADQHRVDRVEHRDHVDRKDAEQHAAGGEEHQRDALETAGVVRVGETRLARAAEKDDAVELDHHVGRQRHREHQRAGGQRHQHVDERLRQAGREQERLQQQPLGDEAVERRQPGDRERADQRQPRDPGHPVDQAAQLAEAALLRRVQHRAGGEEEQALEERVVERVVEHGGQRDRGEQRLAVRLEQDGEADAGDDDADVLDRRVGEQPLHVGLHAGEDHAEQRRREAQHQRDHAPPPELPVQQVEGHAQQAVDRGLQHHAAHQRRDRRRRRRVRLGQPDVQRQQAGLGAEAEQRQEEGDAGPRAGQHHRAHRAEGVVAAAALQHAEAQQDGDGADVRDQQVEEAGAPDLGDAVVGGDQEVRRQRHRLPGHHEHVGVVGDQHQRHRGEEQRGTRSTAGPAPCLRPSGSSRPRTPRSRRSRRRAAAGRTRTARRGAGGTAGRAGPAAAPSIAAAARWRRTRPRPAPVRRPRRAGTGRG